MLIGGYGYEYGKCEVYRFILSFPDGENALKNVNEALNIDNESERLIFINGGFKYEERSKNDTVEGTL